MSQCGTAHYRICGDALIEKVLPEFFKSNPRARKYEEIQVCIKCGDVLKITYVFYEDLFKKEQFHNYPDAVKPPRGFHVVEEEKTPGEGLEVAAMRGS